MGALILWNHLRPYYSIFKESRYHIIWSLVIFNNMDASKNLSWKLFPEASGVSLLLKRVNTLLVGSFRRFLRMVPGRLYCTRFYEEASL